MDQIITIIDTFTTVAVSGAAAWAGFKGTLMGYAFMTKNHRKLEEAQEGIQNVLIGLVIAIVAKGFVIWIKSQVG